MNPTELVRGLEDVLVGLRKWSACLNKQATYRKRGPTLEARRLLDHCPETHFLGGLREFGKWLKDREHLPAHTTCSA